jgi:hypothetical protein
MPVRDRGFVFRGKFYPVRGSHRMLRKFRRRRRVEKIKKELKKAATHFGI